MSLQYPQLPHRFSDCMYCTIKDLMRLFRVSRPTIDRWCRDVPNFPPKRKLGAPGVGNCSTRFLVSDVATYVDGIGGS